VKIEPQSVYVGLGVAGALAGGLACWRRPFVRVFAGVLGVFIAFELVCLLTALRLLGAAWWMIHIPSAIALGGDEILERHGPAVSAVFHVGDLLLWSALVTIVCMLVIKNGARGPAAAAEADAPERPGSH
jgi:hypothetical protein